MPWFRRSPPGDPLAVTMTGVKLGDRLLIIGCAKVKLVAQLALKPGLTGRACAVDEDAAKTARAADVALKEGALLESATAPYGSLPYSQSDFDLVVTNHALTPLTMERRIVTLAEVHRILRQGGRSVAIEPASRGGTAEIEAAFKSAGFRAVRTLAERDGLAFIEGAKRD